ncbi:MAG: vanadium-dependent haloperoxidase [Saprospiraceae bacterium]|nr:vanadium-dependent haloperoxidase [Saprospiraceae bacterium]
MLKIPILQALSTLFVVALLFAACEKPNPNFQQEAANPEFMHRSMQALTSVIKHDLFPPMIGSRIYGYAHIAAYEALNPNGLPPQYQSLAGQIKGLSDIPKPENGKQYCFPLAAVKAYLKVGKKLTFAEGLMDEEIDKIMTEFKAVKMPKDVFERSIALGDTVGGTILKWSGKDNYLQMRSMPKYTVTFDNPARWRPTAPDYADALEPSWNKLRPIVMDSAAQFKPIQPPKFDSTKGSLFYKYAYETYKTVVDSTPERIATAWYWDDNPNATLNSGHVNVARKKISPGGHWLWITMYTCRQENQDIYASTAAYMQVAVGLFDAFVSCWDEKYRSEVIRPESYISKYIDPSWLPIINTPPFPEYTSGHSCVSGASSTILSSIFGDNKAFVDSTEVQFGIPPRSFTSYKEAADQAAFSRMYAGIHYRPACEVGLTQGAAVGQHVLARLKIRK